ncbi:hypothetical protein, partial [Butyricicoccus sp.]|uniref:hypothetical protein n=1 Tax=Butyricicoccus sp. TaxID=2049021 RepID=UPI003F172CBA
MEILATIAGMNLSRHANAKCNAGSIIGGHASDVISDKKGYRISGKPWDVCCFIGYQRNNTPSFLKKVRFGSIAGRTFFVPKMHTMIRQLYIHFTLMR